MIIAQKLREQNIAEFVLYMWQVEDLIRACNFDMNLIAEKIISQYKQSPGVLNEIRHWYEGLVDLMLEEHLEEKGHIEFIKGTVNDLNYIHLKLLNKVNELKYIQLYNEAKNNIVELRQKSDNQQANDIEVCLNGLYGLLMMRLQSKTFSEETRGAIVTFSNLLNYLSTYYHEVEKGTKVL